jgi:hypothetical protein
VPHFQFKLEMRGRHNHAINAAAAVRYRDVAESVREKFEQLYPSGFLHLQRTTFITMICKLDVVLITTLPVATDIFVLIKHGATGLFNFKSIR